MRTLAPLPRTITRVSLGSALRFGTSFYYVLCADFLISMTNQKVSHRYHASCQLHATTRSKSKTCMKFTTALACFFRRTPVFKIPFCSFLSLFCIFEYLCIFRLRGALFGLCKSMFAKNGFVCIVERCLE